MTLKSLLREFTCWLCTGSAISVAVAMLASPSQAAYTLDRWYQMGDDIALSGTPNGENAEDGQPVGSGNSSTGLNGAPITYDSSVEPGNEAATFEPLAAFGATGLPVYVEYGANSNPAAPVPAAGSMNSFGIQFDGVDDYLQAINLNDPSVATPGANKTYPNTVNRGMQLWVYPTNVDGTREVVIDDADFHAFNIQPSGIWNPEVRENLVGSGVSALDGQNQWTHLMMIHDSHKIGGVISYIDGVAVASQSTGYSSLSVVNLLVGANAEDDAGTTADPSTLGVPGWYSGIVDEIEMFVLDDEQTSAYGTFDYTQDNGYFTDVWLPMQSGYSFVLDTASGHNSSSWVKGDINFDGIFDDGDIEAFKDGWLFERGDLPGAGPQAGDYQTLQQGDLDLDGDTDLGDWVLLRQYNSLASAGLSIPSIGELNHPVPEPGSLLLLSLGSLVWLLLGKRQLVPALTR